MSLLLHLLTTCNCSLYTTERSVLKIQFFRNMMPYRLVIFISSY